MTSVNRAAAVVLVSCTALGLGGCRALRSAAGGGTDGGPADAASDARSGDARAVLAPDAGPADDAIPATASEDLTIRSKHLLEAIAKDDSTLASDILFPRDGWMATRDAADAGREWEKRAAGPFRRRVHALSRRHRDADRAEFVSIELGHAMAQATPQHHGWKKALWTVSGSRLTFVIDGRTRTLPVREMTAWRGAWYVTKL